MMGVLIVLIRILRIGSIAGNVVRDRPMWRLVQTCG